MDEALISSWWTQWPEANIGLVLGEASGLFALDIDPRNGGHDSFDELISKHGRLPETAEQITGRGGRHLLFRYSPQIITNFPKTLAPGIDLKGPGGYILVAPSRTQGPYIWDGLEPHEALRNIAHPPEWLIEAVNNGGQRRRLEVVTPNGTTIPEGERNNTLTSIAGTMRRRGMGAKSIFGVLAIHNRKYCSPPLPETEVRAIAQSVARYEPLKPVPQAPRNQTRVQSDSEQDSEELPDLLGFLLNDHGNAERLIALYGDRLRYSHEFKKWLFYDGRRWAIDSTGKAKKLAKLTMLATLAQAVKAGNEQVDKFARGSLDARRITNMLSMAEPEIFFEVSQLDSHAFLLNVLNGTIDLRAGEMHPHNPSDYITKLVHFNYRPDAECPTWLRFLSEVMGAIADAYEGQIERAHVLVDYLQRALGYSLTASTIEKAVFVVFGNGNNGKSTMLSTFRQIVVEYSVLLQVETLMVRQETANSQADLADLRGARFCQTSEAEEGQELSQGKLKRITQGMGKIKATRKYENPIEFQETHKLWLDTNDKPGIRNADDQATFNRLHPLPFTVQIPEDRIDKSLPEKLLAEAEGILAWAVAGAKIWFESGLGRPAEVEAAKEEWHSEVDRLGDFVEECCVTGDGFQARSTPLYDAYKVWAEKASEKVMASKKFTTKLIRRGFRNQHLKRGTFYLGIALKTDEGDK